MSQNDFHRTGCGCDGCTLTPAERVAKASGVGGLDAHDVEVAQLREQVRLLTIAASATGDGFIPLSLREALRTGDEAKCREWPQKSIALMAAANDRERCALQSRDEAWARVASAEESERKAHQVAADFAGAVDDAVKAEREACAALATARAKSEEFNAQHDGQPHLHACVVAEEIAAAIRARKP